MNFQRIKLSKSLCGKHIINVEKWSIHLIFFRTEYDNKCETKYEEKCETVYDTVNEQVNLFLHN